MVVFDPGGGMFRDGSPERQRYRHVSVVEGVAATLRDWIFEGRLARGQQLTEIELTQTLGVGRYSLRAALQLLTREGLVRHERNRGAFVREISAAEIEDMFVIREAIEGQTAALVVERGLDLAPLRKILDEFHNLTGVATRYEVGRLDIRFHRTLNAIVGSARLAQAFDAIEVQLRQLLSVDQKGITYAMTVEYHERLYSELASGDPERARRAIREHINISRTEALMAAFDSRGGMMRDGSPGRQLYRHVSVVEGVAATLREWIFEGRLARGQQLREIQLAQTLGIGRYSLRSALQLLTREGLVRHERNRGAFVREVSAADVEDITLIRDAIEGQAAALVAERGLDLGPLREILSEFHGLTPASTYHELNSIDFRFHRCLNEMVGSERLRQAFDTIQPQVRLLLSVEQDSSDNATIIAAHDRFFSELASGDPERARRAMRKHIDVTRMEALHTVAREKTPSSEGNSHP